MKPDRTAPRNSSWLFSVVVLALFGGVSLHAQEPKLLFAPSADDIDKAREDDLLLRPNTEQTLAAIVRNPGAADVTVTVVLRPVGGRTNVLQSKPLTIKAGETEVVTWDVGPPPPAAAPVPGAAPAPPPAASAGLELKDPTRTYHLLLLQDNKPVGAPRVVKLVRPLDYLGKSSLVFDGVRSKLTVTVEAGAEFRGPPAPVRLVLDPARIPGLVPNEARAGVFRRALTSPGKDVELIAEQLTFENQPANPNGIVTVDVDGYERALSWRTTFSTTSSNNQGQLIQDNPLVRIVADRYWRAGPTYPMVILVDNARRDYRVEIGLDRNRDSEYDEDELVVKRSCREQHIGIRPGSNGALTLTTSVRDWKIDLGVAGLVGEFTVRVRLLDEKGDPVQLLDEAAAIDPEPRTREAIFQSVTYDKSDPDVIALGVVGFPAAKGPNQLLRGKPLKMYARAEDEQSNIKEVAFFLGKLTPEGTLPAGVEPVFAVLTPPDPKAKGEARKPTWLAQLPAPTDKPGKIPVSVQVTNQAGMKSFGTVVIELVDAPKPEPKTPGSMVPKGTIEGTVNEGGRLQPNVPVVLRDAQGVVKDTVRTDNRGRYIFKDIPPGAYYIQATKSSSRTEGSVTAQVQDGQVKTDVNITLRRP